MIKEDQDINPNQDLSEQEAVNSSAAVVVSGCSSLIPRMVTSSVQLNHSGSYANNDVAVNNLNTFTSGTDCFRFGNSEVNSFAALAVNSFHMASSFATDPVATSAKGMISQAVTGHKTVYGGDGFGLTALLDAHKISGVVCMNKDAISMLSHTAAAHATEYRGGYGVAGLMDSYNTLGTICTPTYHTMSSFTGANTTNLYHGSVIEHAYPRNAIAGTSLVTPLSAVCLTTALKPYNHWGFTDSQLVTNPVAMGMNLLTKSASGAIAVSKAMNHKYYGGSGFVIDHLYPDSNFNKGIGAIAVTHHGSPNINWYGSGEAISITHKDIVRSIDIDYDHYVVNQKRDVYKSILDNYNYSSGVLLGDLTVRAGENWSDLISDKISTYVSSLDLYLATKDASLLYGISYLEWEAMAVGYSAGFANSLNLVYDRINSKTNRDKYACRRYNKIIDQKCKIIYKIDLRIIFRNIIRFLFKNMDDEPEGKYVELKKRNNISQPLKLSLYENRGNHFYFKYAA